MNVSQSHDDVLCFKLKSGKVIIVSNLGSETLVLGFAISKRTSSLSFISQYPKLYNCMDRACTFVMIFFERGGG